MPREALQHRVTAVSVAQPRPQLIDGRTVLTSIVREASEQPVYFDVDGPRDNKTAVHPAHVLAMSTEHYDYWCDRLQLPRQAWPAAFWGENLAITGLDENTLPIGTVLRIGPSAVLQVSSPRMPCYKLAWRLGQPALLLDQIAESGRTGIYLQVLSPGWIGVGDCVEVERPAHPQMTVGQVSRLLRQGCADVHGMQQALQLEHLGRQARDSLRTKIDHLLDRKRLCTGRWKGWRRFRVQRIEQETHDVRSYTLVSADGQPIAAYRAGQHVQVRLSSRAGPSYVRAWSLSDFSAQPNEYRISVKRHPQGRASVLLHDELAVGDTVELRCPAGDFHLRNDAVYRTVLISAGIGITPLLAMFKALVAGSSPESAPVVWLHSTRNSQTHALRKDFDRFARLSGLDHTCVTHFTAPTDSDRPGIDFQVSGRIDDAAIVALMAPYEMRLWGRPVSFPGERSEFFVCGPSAFNEDIRRSLLGHGVEPGMIHTEAFAGSVSAPEYTSPSECEVRFVKSGQSVRWLAEDDLSILELAEAAGIEAPNQCRTGSCHECETALLSGAVDYSTLPIVMPPAGRVLLCCTRPALASISLDL